VIARQNTLDVAVEDRCAAAESAGQDGAGGGAADAGQCLQRLEVGRELTATLGHEVARRAVQVAPPGVVAEAAPVVQYLVDVGARQVRERREARREAFVVGDNRGNLGLLQHDLRQPHVVGRGVALPGQVVAAVAVVPVEKALCEFVHGSWLLP
jgi:hypothetical protein